MAAKRILQMDKDGDGMISEEEWKSFAGGSILG
jgi:hypothetical protein